MVESKIRELFNDDKTVYIFDVDGVLAPIEYGEYNHYYYDDEKWALELVKKDFYEDVKPFKTMQDFLKSKDMSRVYVVTKVMNEIELEQKKKFLKKNYNIDSNNVYLVYKDEEKLNVIKNIQKKYPLLEDKYFVLIEDTVNILSYVMENSSYSTVHISSFLK